MRWLSIVLLFAGLGGGLGACAKGDPVKCDKACRNYAQLVFWDKADKEIAAVPAEQRDALRQQKLAEFTKNLERGIDLCTSKCVAANYDKDVNCWLAAKTAADINKCKGDD